MNTKHVTVVELVVHTSYLLTINSSYKSLFGKQCLPHPSPPTFFFKGGGGWECKKLSACLYHKLFKQATDSAIVHKHTNITGITAQLQMCYSFTEHKASSFPVTDMHIYLFIQIYIIYIPKKLEML